MNEVLENPQASEILQASPCGVLILDKTRHIKWLNKILQEYLGENSEQLIGQSVDNLSESKINSLVTNEITEIPAADKHTSIWLRACKIPADQANMDNTTYFFIDVTKQQQLESRCWQLEKELASKNTRDSITGLLNLKGLMQELDTQISRSRRYNNPLSIIRMDIVNFENLDDKTEALINIGYYLNDRLRWSDMAGRTDDDKFLFVLPETQSKAAKTLAKKVGGHLSRPKIIAGTQSTIINVCFGVTSWIKGDDIGKLMSRAEEMVEKARKGAANVVSG